MTSPPQRSGRRAAAALAVAAAVLALAVPALAQQRPTAPVGADGLTASDGTRTLRVSQSQGLTSSGQVVGVSGSGFDPNKGIYVALCVVTPADRPPSPCGGGIDQTGATGASAWVSSNPPTYGDGLATPYGPGGSFSVNITVAAVVSDGYDCRRIQCAIVSRNDHTRTADRGQDIFIPVTFADGPSGQPTTTAPPASTAPTTTPTTIAPPPPASTTEPSRAPDVEISADGLTGTAGARSIALSAASDLDPAGTEVTVDGAGFDPAVPVQVTLCRAAASATEAPGPCLAGSSPDASRVVAVDPQEGDGYVAFADDGSFTLDLEVAAVIDGDTDCREVECAVTVRRYAVGDDDTAAAAADRTLDLAVPVAFLAESPVEPADEPDDDEEAAAPAVTASDTDDGGGSSLPWLLGGLTVLAAAGGGAAWFVRSRRVAAP
ncbi:MAG: hypothetical protein GXY13_08895 [Acidimicrobiales bacterium]|nr:hypothetical protein [Acidimicrobiales bacterium]